jgi:transposase-like protein
MAMKVYSDEFKADAVALFESTPGQRTRALPLAWASRGSGN